MSFRIWGICNVYRTAKIGANVNIGWFSEIGDGVVIGSNTRVGAFAFICAGVTIEANCFIGPRVTFTNDKYPPAKSKAEWLPTLVRKGASIGAACTILCGVEIGEGATIGAGSVVTKNIPPGETWCGVPARRLRR